ncbi:MAG: lipopolysaccharide biosynthesis protein, partial [Candidatus Thiodiazotropha taylori]
MEEEELLGFADYLAILKRRKKQLIIPATLILLLSLGLAVGLPSIYRAEATILIEQQEIPSELVRSTVTSYAGERIQVISQRVMTTENLGKIIDSYGLYKDERDDTSLTLLSEELREDIELEMISADVIDPRSGRPTIATIAFKLSFSNKNPRIAQKVTNELVSLYLDENLRQRTQSALETSTFLSTEADRLNQEITELEVSLADFKKKHVDNLPELQSLNIQLMERNELELSETIQRIRSLEERKIYLQSELSQMSPTTDIYNSSGNRIMGTEDRLRALQTEYLALATRYTNDHPTLISMKDEIETLERELSAMPAQKKKKAQSDNPAYLQLETQLQAANSE